MDHNQDRQHDQSQTPGADARNELAGQPQQGFSPFPSSPASAAALKHSGPGIAAFVLGLLNILLVIIGFIVVIAGVAEFVSPDGTFASDDLEANMNAALLGGVFMILGALALSLVGTVLGIVGVVIKNRRKAFGIIGLILNALLLLSVVVLMVIGLALQGAA